MARSVIPACARRSPSSERIVSGFARRDQPMPAIFAGHGNPMYAIDDNPYRLEWERLGRELPRPQGVLCISAHWETEGVRVTGAVSPETIHDFYGFPQSLFDVQYPAPGSPELAELIAAELPEVAIDAERGLDHGAWAVLRGLYPDAGVPVVQLSLDRRQPPQWHYELGKRLAFLRRCGVLLLGSGNIVHNLGQVVWRGEARHDWAVQFDADIATAIEAGDDAAVIDYQRFGEAAMLSVPTREHYLPLLYILGARGEGEGISFFNEVVEMGSLSMRSLLLPGG